MLNWIYRIDLVFGNTWKSISITFQRHAQSLPLRESTFPNQVYYGTAKENMVFYLCFLGCIWNPTPSILMELSCHEYTPWLLEFASCLWSQTLLQLKWKICYLYMIVKIFSNLNFQIYVVYNWITRKNKLVIYV